MVGRKGFFLRERRVRNDHEKKTKMTHRFEVFRAPIDLTLPIAPHLAATSALPWWCLVLVLRTRVLVLFDRPLLVQPKMGAKPLLSRKRPARTLIVRTRWRMRRTDMLLKRSPSLVECRFWTAAAGSVYARIALFCGIEVENSESHVNA
jgi:hypothetical protein